MIDVKVVIPYDCRARNMFERWDVSKARSDSEVESKRDTMAPAWQIDIRGASSVGHSWCDSIFWERTFRKAWLEKTWFFKFWVQESGSGKVENEILEMISGRWIWKRICSWV